MKYVLLLSFLLSSCSTFSGRMDKCAKLCRDTELGTYQEEDTKCICERKETHRIKGMLEERGANQ